MAGKKTQVFIREIRETGHMLTKHWVLWIYAVLLITGESRSLNASYLIFCELASSTFFRELASARSIFRASNPLLFIY